MYFPLACFDAFPYKEKLKSQNLKLKTASQVAAVSSSYHGVLRDLVAFTPLIVVPAPYPDFSMA